MRYGNLVVVVEEPMTFKSISWEVRHVGRERGRKTWKECVEDDLKILNLDPSTAADRESWRWLGHVSIWPVHDMTLND